MLWPHLTLGPASTLAIAGTSDPLDGSGNFEVRVTVDLQDAWPDQGIRADLAPLGLPRIPADIQRLGQARRLPIEVGEDLELAWEAHLRLPEGWSPSLPGGTLSTDLRNITWTSDRTGGPPEGGRR